MAEYLGCGKHGVARVLGYVDNGKTLVLGCGDQYPVAELQVSIFEAPDSGPNAPEITHEEVLRTQGTESMSEVSEPESASLPVDKAAAAAETLPPEAQWSDVVKAAEDDSRA